MEIELVIFHDADIFTTIFLLSCVKRFAMVRWKLIYILLLKLA